MQLDAYLQRISYSGPRAIDLATLSAIHRAHLAAIPYENLDIHLGQPLTLGLPAIYRKLVIAQRGGWCFEMNALLAWAYQQLGFSVELLASSVNERPAPDAPSDHLLLRVALDQPYLADVGFGNGLLEPIPLRAGTYQQDFFTFRLERLANGWYFHNQDGSGFGFTETLRTLDHFATQNTWLQTAPESGFVQKLNCHRYTPNNLVSLRGAILWHYTPNGTTNRILASADEFATILADDFNLTLPDTSTLWDATWVRHLAWLETRR